MPNDPNAPTLPPIPASPLQDAPPSPSATPSQAAASSLGSSIDTDMPISGIVAALKNTPQTETPVLTEVKVQNQTPTAPALAPTAPSVAPSIPSPVQGITTPVEPNDKAASSPPPLPKSPLYEDPDQIKVSGAS